MLRLAAVRLDVLGHVGSRQNSFTSVIATSFFAYVDNDRFSIGHGPGLFQAADNRRVRFGRGLRSDRANLLGS